MADQNVEFEAQKLRKAKRQPSRLNLKIRKLRHRSTAPPDPSLKLYQNLYRNFDKNYEIKSKILPTMLLQ